MCLQWDLILSLLFWDPCSELKIMLYFSVVHKLQIFVFSLDCPHMLTQFRIFLISQMVKGFSVVSKSRLKIGGRQSNVVLVRAPRVCHCGLVDYFTFQALATEGAGGPLRTTAFSFFRRGVYSFPQNFGILSTDNGGQVI